jgi:A/G-specific adenine glycosylase
MTAKAPGPELLSAGRIRSLRRTILDWSNTGLRRLPWRETRDPWAILVSEVMLQQTQVSRVLDPYRRFLLLFPTPRACARKGSAAVLRAWDGLGYNRRALNLHRCAVVLQRDHQGALPEDLATLQSLPGVGPYTARAVMAFGHGARVGIVETNVARVLARAAVGRPLSAKEAQSVADRLVPRDQSWEFNQAMIDLGALYCTARDPSCEACPLRAVCRWRSSKDPRDPAKTTAGVSKGQSTFDGSDRQGRGRLVKALRAGPVAGHDAVGILGWGDDSNRVDRVIGGLVRDGLVEQRADGTLALSGGPSAP